MPLAGIATRPSPTQQVAAPGAAFTALALVLANHLALAPAGLAENPPNHSRRLASAYGLFHFAPLASP